MLSFRRRLALAHVVVVTAVLAIAATLTYLSLVASVRAQLDGALLALAEQEASMLAANPALPVIVHEAGAASAPPSYARLDRLVQIIDRDGKVLARSANLGASTLPVDAALLARLADGQAVFENLDYGDEPTRRVSVPVSGGRALAVQVAGSLDDVDHNVDAAGWIFLAMGVVLVVVLTVTGTLMTGRVFGAIDNVTRQAQRISDQTLSDRLPHPGPRDEMGRLIDTLNDMLARLEQAFEAQRRFTADASHELRSPLSRLRTELEITLRRPRGQDEYVEALRSSLDEVVRLTTLAEELLTLARLDSGQESATASAVLIAPILEEVVRRARGTAERRDVDLRLDLHGDREPGAADDADADVDAEQASTITASLSKQLLVLVATNLVDNAVKFAPAGGVVRVSLGAREGWSAVVVEDDGPGIPEEERPRLFERFYRGAGARASDVPGTGLGLALCDAIVRAAGGRIDIDASPLGGGRFTVLLPAPR
ncbi:ATP-binding protein [Roseateles sp.]|uniref:sensor histidine kinase n=1 Tax=Roseateles sp. TaxID=1971397 RepID=UPI0031D6CED0